MAVPAILVSIAGYVLKDRFTAAQATRAAAEEFDHYLKLSEAELTELSFALSRRYPDYKYWEWFTILKNLRAYGKIIDGGGNGEGNGQGNGEQKESNLLLYAAIAGAVIILIGGLK